MKNAKITRAFLKSAAENAIKKRRNSICNAFVLWNVLYALILALQSEWHPRFHDVDGFELALQLAADGGCGDHRSVVCTQATVWYAEADALLVAVVL